MAEREWSALKRGLMLTLEIAVGTVAYAGTILTISNRNAMGSGSVSKFSSRYREARTVSEAGEDGSGVERPNTFDRRLANIPIMDITLCCSQSPTASPLERSTMSRTSSDGAMLRMETCRTDFRKFDGWKIVATHIDTGGM